MTTKKCYEESWRPKDIERMCEEDFSWTFEHEKALCDMDAVFLIKERKQQRVDYLNNKLIIFQRKTNATNAICTDS